MPFLLYNYEKKIIVSDLGNVVVKFDHSIAIKRALNFSPLNFDEIHDAVFHSDEIREFEKGRIKPSDFFEFVRSTLRFNGLSYEEFLPIWNEIFTLNEEVVAIYERLLASGYRLIALSNINPLHLDYIKENYPFIKHLDKIIASCEVGYRKPEPQIYQAALDYLQARPDNIIYIDDLSEKVAGTQNLGICGIHYQDPQSLIENLEACGIEAAGS